MTVTRDGHSAARNQRRNDRATPGAPRPQARSASTSRGTMREESWLGRTSRNVSEFMDARPLIDYTMIRSVVFVLAGLGLVMVMSSSMAMSYLEAASPWSTVARQGLMVLGGLIAFVAALHIPLRMLHKISLAMVLVSFVLLFAVLPFGAGGQEVGSQSWLDVGPVHIQPSEIARLSFAVWGAQEVARKGISVRRETMPFYLVAIVMFGLIALQKDLGMAFSFLLIVGLILIFAGISLRLLASFGALFLGLLAAIFLSGGFRSDRFLVYFDALFGNFEDTRGIAFQSHQGFLSLADGGVFGVGLGQSRAKWFYLPEAKNDFIFAIIGEELGLWGGALVIGLFAALGYFGLRTARRAATREQRLLAAALTSAVVVQAMINISYVVGLMPVTGIQLPMISAGGTSAVVTFGAMGILASVARHEPDAVSAMQNYGRPRFDRIFRVREPQPASAYARGSAAASGSRRPTGQGDAAHDGAHDAAHRTRSARRGNRSSWSGRVVSAKEREARFGTPVTARGATASRATRQEPPVRARRASRPDRSAGATYGRRGTGRPTASREHSRTARPSQQRNASRYDDPRNRRARDGRRAG